MVSVTDLQDYVLVTTDTMVLIVLYNISSVPTIAQTTEFVTD
jgi:hypothetical protein